LRSATPDPNTVIALAVSADAAASEAAAAAAPNAVGGHSPNTGGGRAPGGTWWWVWRAWQVCKRDADAAAYGSDEL